MKRAILIAACFWLTACTHSEITTAFDTMVASALAGQVYVAQAHLPPDVSAAASRLFANILAAAPKVETELNSTDPVSTQAIRIAEILAPYAEVIIPGAPANLVDIVHAEGAAVKALLSLLRVPMVQPGGTAAVPFKLTAADRREIHKSVLKAQKARRDK